MLLGRWGNDRDLRLLARPAGNEVRLQQDVRDAVAATAGARGVVAGRLQVVHGAVTPMACAVGAHTRLQVDVAPAPPASRGPGRATVRPGAPESEHPARPTLDHDTFQAPVLPL